MTLNSNNPAPTHFRLREEFLLYLETLCSRLNKSVWSVGDESLAVEHYAIEQKVITKIEKKPRKKRKDSS